MRRTFLLNDFNAAANVRDALNEPCLFQRRQNAVNTRRRTHFELPANLGNGWGLFIKFDIARDELEYLSLPRTYRHYVPPLLNIDPICANFRTAAKIDRILANIE